MGEQEVWILVIGRKSEPKNQVMQHEKTNIFRHYHCFLLLLAFLSIFHLFDNTSKGETMD
jgi:hypothetical protein